MVFLLRKLHGNREDDQSTVLTMTKYRFQFYLALMYASSQAVSQLRLVDRAHTLRRNAIIRRWHYSSFFWNFMKFIVCEFTSIWFLSKNKIVFFSPLLLHSFIRSFLVPSINATFWYWTKEKFVSIEIYRNESIVSCMTFLLILLLWNA